ncbi:signal peptidase complex subunit 1 [Dictyostelium discoideum AX4]|uniref:Signal peptidase complex subunit 1 n=1 Tax=Dictyostelium discoideum TaxID=44689 RepID=SPCS1_DICDI|nr:signal peptidase complex subunit 1 [Dictyostelium discoideum AX4]Q54Y83.1 RecName: Full=Signal peptidase complex subunit 1 [Dictyostelium discoideum]EAL68358.1 signal peptidase complex subunit 1 [Dictyostelium discoideum AX4]|eukprot:XP_642319.1 signal peptidase complex subunit 1 [Dictyostelium discoideum AX4]
MDFEGQKLAEYIYQYTIIIFGVIGWIIGFIKQDFSITFYSVALGTFLSLILCLPNWKIYCQHPLSWQKPIVQSTPTDKSK